LQLQWQWQEQEQEQFAVAGAVAVAVVVGGLAIIIGLLSFSTHSLLQLGKQKTASHSGNN
jgi:hypothetical protein